MSETHTQDRKQKAVRAVVRGAVQGVGFRYFTRVSAERAGVSGWVRNREDGTVEIRAEGTEDRLKQFLKAVRRGPTHAHVTDVDVKWEPPTGRDRSFRIRY